MLIVTVTFAPSLSAIVQVWENAVVATSKAAKEVRSVALLGFPVRLMRMNEAILPLHNKWKILTISNAERRRTNS